MRYLWALDVRDERDGGWLEEWLDLGIGIGI